MGLGLCGAGGAVPARYSDEAPLHQASPGVSGGPAAKLQGPLAMVLCYTWTYWHMWPSSKMMYIRLRI